MVEQKYLRLLGLGGCAVRSRIRRHVSRGIGPLAGYSDISNFS
jgi:hypothetical protein